MKFFVFLFVIVCEVHSKEVRIVVASSFDREINMAEIKINESAEIAERLVFCEGRVTQSGYPRFLRLKQLQKIYHGIEICVAECDIAKHQRDYTLGWGCEGAPREAVKKAACRGEPDSTVVVLSDADEIISRNTLKKLKKNPPPFGYHASFKNSMSVHIYGFFWQDVGRTYSTALALTCQTIRSGKHSKRIIYPKFSGWHCSYCIPVDEYFSKMHSMLKGDGWLSLSDHYWSMETLWSFRQHGIPLNGKKKLSEAVVPPPVFAQEHMPYLIKNTNMKLKPPNHPFNFP